MTLEAAEKPQAARATYMRYVLWLVPVALLCIIGLVLLAGEEITLRSLGQTAVLSRFEEKSTLRPVIAVLQPGQRVSVEGCESDKSDFEIRVRLPSGQTGYVSAGDYRLERRDISLGSLASPGSIVLSCRSLFAPLSEPYPKSEKE
jgi:hypothetical protein